MPIQLLKDENQAISGSINYVIANDYGLIQTNTHQFTLALD